MEYLIYVLIYVMVVSIFVSIFLSARWLWCIYALHGVGLAAWLYWFVTCATCGGRGFELLAIPIGTVVYLVAAAFVTLSQGIVRHWGMTPEQRGRVKKE